MPLCYNKKIMATPLPNTPNTKSAPPPTAQELAVIREAERKQKAAIAGGIAFVVLIVAMLGTAIYFLMRPETPAENVGRIRDIFIIVVALESLIIGVALIVLIVQLASLINLIQNEVRPILNATNDTVNTLRGTAEFLGENVVEPVIKLNGYLAGLKRMLELLGAKPK